jgi:hypothetical protein
MLFWKQIRLFIVVLAALIILMTILNRVLFRIYNPLILDSNVTTVFLGDSHIKYAINDSLISNSVNIAQDADSYFYTYSKTIELIDQNRNLDTIFVGFVQHNLSKFIEDRWLLNDDHLGNRLEIYFPILETDGHLFFLKNKTTVYFKSILNNYFFLLKLLGIN